MELELRDRAFLITGGSDGLGLALAQRLVADGAQVAICGRDRDRLSQAQLLLGTEALCFAADVTKSDEIDAFVDVVLQRFGRLDGAVNNAGRSSNVAVADSSDEDWREDYELKVIAALHVSRRVIEPLAATQGAIINVLSIHARTPGANSTPTTASRAAGLALTKALAGELGPQGVRVNAILIGLIESGQWERRAQQSGQSVEDFYASLGSGANIPLGRVGRAEEFADLASFLLSPRASYLTGVGINLDGGLSPVI
jgi:NAD(P)-dependent dehydrogenase (short-subunit alcohol dehydrogenase family)